jgi:DnaK suppressor protein
VDKEALKTKIESLIQKTELDIKDMEGMTQPVKPENSLGRISRMDAIQNKSVMELNLRNKKEKLSQLKLALSNLDSPNFGVCNTCKRPIQEARILFMPESTKCIHCASRR